MEQIAVGVGAEVCSQRRGALEIARAQAVVAALQANEDIGKTLKTEFGAAAELRMREIELGAPGEQVRQIRGLDVAPLQPGQRRNSGPWLWCLTIRDFIQPKIPRSILATMLKTRFSKLLICASPF